ncbi:MAG: nitrilase-related carbon-nitrogen hydrolase [Spirochaetia bacterium]
MRRVAVLTLSSFLLVAVSVFAEDFAEHDDGVLHVAAVQAEVAEETYLDVEEFESHVEKLVAEAERRGAELVVFPEYINVFLLFESYAPVIRRASSMDDALHELAAPARAASTEALQALLRRRAPQVERTVRRMWSNLAREYGVAIVAGTYFAPVGEESIHNRAIVFDEDGRLLHAQDKVFLTAFETDVLDLGEGDLEEAETFEIDGFEIGLTICRDSFFSDFEPELGDADLWLELRANGELYTEAVRRRFEGALPERVEATSTAAGVSASLTGSLLDLVWEGPSYAVDASGRRVGASGDVRGSSLLLTEVRR